FNQSACASAARDGRDDALRPGSPIVSIAYTRNDFAHVSISLDHTAAFAPEPCSNTSGGACSGPHASTKVSPSRVATGNWRFSIGQLARTSRYRVVTTSAPSLDL